MLAASLVCWAPLALAQQAIPSLAGLRTPNPQPLPAIEAGMHTALINSIAVDAGGHWAVTASDDKTARIWDLASGQQQMVLRVPIGPGPEGKLYAAALTPDGTLVAVGGYTGSAATGSAIHLFDRVSGRLLHTLPRLPDVVRQLTFSRDGRWLAAALASGGVRLFERGPQGRWQPRAAAAPGSGGISTSVAFAPDGRLLVSVASEPSSSAGGELQLYGPPSAGGFALLQRRQLSGGREPFSARFSPDGRKIAVGFHDSPRLQLLDGRSLAPLASPDQQGLGGNGNLARVAWSPAGDLLAAGSLQSADGSFPLVIWPAGGGAPRLVPLGLRNTVMALEPLADGRLLAGGAGPAWVLLNANRQPLLFRGPPVLDHRDAPGGSVGPGGFAAFRLAPDGRWIEFRAVARTAAGTSSRLARFDLIGRGLSFPTDPAAGGLAPRRSGLPIAAATLPPEASNEEVRSQAISREGDRVALGSEWNLRLLNRSGRLLWRTPLPATAWLVNLSADGRHVLAALGDGSIRWYRSSDGTEALALFVHPDGRWLLWTPEGFYDASPATAAYPTGGASLLGYHLNQGPNREATFVSTAQLQQSFFRPDLIARRLAGDEKPIKAAVAQVGDVRQLLRATGLPPVIRLVDPPTRLANGEISFSAELIDQGGGIGSLTLLIDGKPIPERSAILPTGKVRQRLPRMVPHPDGRPPRVELKAQAARSRGIESERLLVPIPPALLEPRRPSRLHLLSVGISAYRDPRLLKGVHFAADDARAFHRAFQGNRAALPLQSTVLLTNGEATTGRIRQELQHLADPRRVNAEDVVVLFLAGHGVNDAAGNYVYKTVNEPADGSGFDGRQLLELLSAIPAINVLVVLDTCHAGSFRDAFRDDLNLRRLNLLSGRAVLAASASQAKALEHPDLGHGLFTGVLLSGLAGQANDDGSSEVSVREIVNFASRELLRWSRERFGGEQRPVFLPPDDDFSLTRSR